MPPFIGSRWRHFLPLLVTSLSRLSIAVAPVAVTAMAVWFLIGAPVTAFRPVYVDEVDYWHQTLTFATVGTSGGIYSTEEHVAPVWRFGTHGPFFPMLYGIAGAVFGWHRHSPLLFNLVWLASASAILVLLCRPSASRALLVAVAIATFWPVPYWAVTAMQESFHQGVAIIVGGSIAAVLARTHHRVALVIAFASVGVATLVRGSWALLFPVLGALAVGVERPRPRMVAGAAMGMVVAAALVWAYTSTVAPDPEQFRFLRMTTVQRFIADGRDNLLSNIGRLQDKSDDYDPLELLHRAQYLFLLTAVAISAVYCALRRRAAAAIEWSVHLLNVGGIVAAMLLMYVLTNQTEHRIIAPHVLATLVGLCLSRRRPLVLVALLVVGSNIAASGIFTDSFRENRQANFSGDGRAVRVIEEIVAPRVPYVEAVSPWCNTLLTSELYPAELIALPAGIGISNILRAERQQVPPKSKYLLLNDAARAQMGETLRVTPLVTLGETTLYRNLDTLCDSP